MKCKILRESAGRMRIHAEQRRMSFQQADILEAYLRQVEGVTEVKVYDRTLFIMTDKGTSAQRFLLLFGQG